MNIDKLDIDKSDKLHSSVYQNNCICFKGNPVEINLKNYSSEININILLEEKKICKIWGQVIDNNQSPVDCAVITLLKPRYVNGRFEYSEVATTLSDCEGFYQFEVSQLSNGLNYKVITGKS